jgi:hypothetical protein
VCLTARVAWNVKRYGIYKYASWVTGLAFQPENYGMAATFLN